MNSLTELAVRIPNLNSIMSSYIIVGRICDGDDIVKVVIAESQESASTIFANYLAEKNDWNGEDDIYIDHVIALANAVDTAVSKDDVGLMLSESDYNVAFGYTL